MDEPDLFGDTLERMFWSLPEPKPIHTRHRATDPDTSRQAARMQEGKINAKQRMVLAVFQENPEGITDLELSNLIVCSSYSTYRTRRGELVEAGLIEDTGRRVKQDGSNRIIWRVTPKGAAVVL